MASVAENLSMLQALFAPTVRSFEQFNAGRLALAESNVRRAQALQDQQHDADMKRELTNAQLAADDRRTQMYLDRQELSNRAAEHRAAAATKVAQAALDAKQTAAEEKATREAVRKTYAQYKAAGGTKKLADFGDEVVADTLYAIQDELGPMLKTRDRDSFAGQARLLKERESALGRMLELTPEEEQQAFDSSLMALAADKRAADGIKFYNEKVGKGDPPELAMQQLRKKYPEAASALTSQMNMLRAAKVDEKAKGKDYLSSLAQLGTLRSGLLKFAQDRELGEDSFSLLFDVAPEVKPASPSAPPQAGSSSIDALRKGLGGGSATTGKSSPAVDSGAGYGGIYGGVQSLVREIPNVVDEYRLAALSPQNPWTGLSNVGSYIWGGERGFQEKIAERNREADQLRAIIATRRFGPPSPYAEVVAESRNPLASYLAARRIGGSAPAPLVFR